MASIKINDAAIKRMQDDFNSKLRDTIWGVRNEMVGQPADAVYARLVSQLRSAFGASFKPNEPEMRKVAKAISEDDLKH